MTVQMVRFSATEASVAEVERAIESTIAAINEVQPSGTRYAAGKLADGLPFLLLLELADGVENPLPSIVGAGAAIGLTLFFAGAVIAHLRARNTHSGFPPPTSC